MGLAYGGIRRNAEKLVEYKNLIIKNGADNILCTGFQDRGANIMIKSDLSNVYRDYIICLNRQGWPQLGQFVDNNVCHNDKPLGLSGYRKMLEKDFNEIPDLHFNIQLLISDAPYIASRLVFDCSPKGKFLGLDINGKKVSFTENVFYEFRGKKIVKVWSVIDKMAIEAQI
jgi:predicted ester cyclase